MTEEMQIKRGDVFWAKVPYVQDLTTSVYRPVIIISNNIGNKHSDNVIVIPTTTQMKHLDLPTNVSIGSKITGTSSLALCEHVRILHKSRLGAYIGHLSRKRMKSVENALLIAIGLEETTEDGTWIKDY